MTKKLLTLVTGGLLAFGLLATPASANDADIIRRGTCTNGGTWKIKASPENGRIEVEFEVDINRNGQVFNVTLTQDGSQIFSGARTTQAPSGSFEVRRVAPNTAGTDVFVGRAVRQGGGNVCQGSVTWPS